MTIELGPDKAIDRERDQTGRPACLTVRGDQGVGMLVGDDHGHHGDTDRGRGG
jgi:hypothetical protein